MIKRNFFSVCAIALLQACGGSEAVDGTSSGFQKPAFFGDLQGIDDVSFSDDGYSYVTGNRYQHEVGSTEGKGLLAHAGIVAGASVSRVPTSGVARMSGSFTVTAVQDIHAEGGLASGFATRDSGNITLTADFGAGTLTGSSRGQNLIFSDYHNGNSISVNGRFSGNDLNGTVSYNGVSGPLDGLIGENEAIGVFHADRGSQIHSGGFIVN